MKKHYCLILEVTLFCLFLLGSCSKGEKPITILAFHPFKPTSNCNDLAFYTEWKNNSNKYAVDSLILHLSSASDSKSNFSIQIVEPKSVAPQERNNKTIIYLNENDLPNLQPDTTLEIRIQQVNFADKPSWEDNLNLGKSDCSAAIDSGKRIGIYPIVLNQALFYETSPNPSMSDSLNFQVDWTNISETSSIIGLVYRITARTADGSIVYNTNGESCSFISCYYKDPSQWIPPSSDNKVFMEKIPASIASAFRENHASVFEISIYKAIDSYGIIIGSAAKTNNY